MPSYDYICNVDDCKVETFEVRKDTFEDTVERCPKCGYRSKEKKSVYQFSFRM